jgi:hypothetical protein
MQKENTEQRVSNIALPQAQHKATSPTRKTLWEKYYFCK